MGLFGTFSFRWEISVGRKGTDCVPVEIGRLEYGKYLVGWRERWEREQWDFSCVIWMGTVSKERNQVADMVLLYGSK